MKVLMISGDKNILVAGSVAHARFELQKKQVDQLDVFVWPQVHSFREIRAAVVREHYDVITAQDPFWRGHFAWHLSHKHHSKLNIQVHTDLRTEPWWRRAWAYFQLRNATSIRVVSEALKQQIAPYVRAPIFVLPVFVDVDSFKVVQAKPHQQKTILWIGRFEVEKDPLSALTVLKEVRSSGIEAKLVMLGAGSLEPALRKSAETLPIEFAGWGKDPKPYLESADVVLCTSVYESWGASIVEALAAGVPVVAPDVGVAKEAGAVVVPRSELAQVVMRVLQSGERGVLKIVPPTAAEWAVRWRETLL
ncbi:MAG: hypothetical protein RLZZ26_313 [Candidatus Parcubacteria bacterium]|jgi:glycosyltransferase involved in cell wall biosynthesis